MDHIPFQKDNVLSKYEMLRKPEAQVEDAEICKFIAQINKRLHNDRTKPFPVEQNEFFKFFVIITL